MKQYSQGHVVYKVDGRVLKLVELLLRIEKRAAEETGQWRGRAGTQKERASVATEGDRPESSPLNHEELKQLARLVDKATITKVETSDCSPIETVSNIEHERH